MPYLLKHRKTAMYWFRRSVPPPLREAIGKTAVKLSLRTKDVSEAKRRAHQVALEVDRMFEQARAA